MQSYIGRDVVRIKEKYSRGRRGAPAKGVGRVTGARVQIPPSPFGVLETTGESSSFWFSKENCVIYTGKTTKYGANNKNEKNRKKI